LTAESSSRWAGSITKATHDQWALARRAQLAHIQSLEAGIAMITRRLSLPLGQKGTNNTPGGYRSRREWFAKTRRLGVLRDRLDAVRSERDAGRVRIVRAGRRLLTTRHHLDAAQVTEVEWRRRWAAERRFLHADGESGKRWGNETIRITPDGEVSLKLPAPLAGLANARHGRYVLATRVTFPHRGLAWRDRIETDQAVAYRIDENVARGRWYITASWQHRPPTASVPLKAAVTGGVIGVDANDDRLAGMAAGHGLTVIAVDPAYTSQWGARHWRTPLCTPRRTTTRHEAAAVAIGRRALGYPIRRRTAPPRDDQSDRRGHRTVQASSGIREREGTRLRHPGPRTRSVPPGRGANAGNQDTHHRWGRPAERESWRQDSPPLSP
jgi:hypothetical protein